MGTPTGASTSKQVKESVAEIPDPEYIEIDNSTVDTMQQPWLVARDFNDYANQRERRSFSANHNTIRTKKFLDRVNRCNLIDLGSFGPRIKWTNKKQGLVNTMERLDRALCNAEWRTMFPEAIVRVLPRTYSDHSPLVVYTQGRNALVPEI
ncbi:hypothetical protein ACSBR2_007070 [Camellia fascicularis]